MVRAGAARPATGFAAEPAPHRCLAARPGVPGCRRLARARRYGLASRSPRVAGWGSRSANGPLRVPLSRETPMKPMSRCIPFLLLAVPVLATSQGRSVDWPVYGGSQDHTHYSTLDQITPANVASLKVAWTYETHDEFPGSEMQNNPLVLDGVMYVTTPKLRVVALEAATGRELWSYDPNGGRPPTSRFRHRGLVVTGDRVLFTYRNRLIALDR